MYCVGPPGVKHASPSSMIPPSVPIVPHGGVSAFANCRSSSRVPLNTLRSSSLDTTPSTLPVSECCQNSHFVHGDGMFGHAAVVYCAIHSGELVRSALPVRSGHE